jgi:hypothetical protein
MKFEAVTGTENVLSQVMTFVSLRDGARNPVGGERVFSAEKDIGDVGFDGERGDDHPFYELVRVLFHQQPVFERAGLHLVGVDHQVSWVRRILAERDE